MVQFQQWNDPVRLDQASEFVDDIPTVFRWIGQTGGAKPETQYVWPFIDTNWLGSRFIIYTQNNNSTSEFTRQLNGVDVGQKLVLGNGDPPAVPTVFLDLSIVAVTKGDLLGYRRSSTTGGSQKAIVNFTSYFEFADGLWGF